MIEIVSDPQLEGVCLRGPRLILVRGAQTNTKTFLTRSLRLPGEAKQRESGAAQFWQSGSWGGGIGPATAIGA